MKFLDVFNEIEKGNYALTDEAIYASLQNNDELIPLYGGNKEHHSTDRRISITAKTKNGVPITVFSGEGIIISLDGSAGSMTYKNGEKFALNHHAGFITLREDASKKINLEFFSIFLQNFYRELGVSDGSKTLSLTQIYAEEFDLPSYDVQCRIASEIKCKQQHLYFLQKLKASYAALLDKEFANAYQEYQAKQIPIEKCLSYISGSSDLTEEKNYQRLINQGKEYTLLTGATEKARQRIIITEADNINCFSGKEGLLVTRKGKAGKIEYLPADHYIANDDAYILFVRDDCRYQISLYWLSIQYKQSFLDYSSSSDNGTWNMTGFFTYTRIDIPSYEEQISLVSKYNSLYQRIEAIERIEEQYRNLLSKEIA